MPPQNKHNRLLWKEAQNVRYRHPERSRGVQSTLIQSSESPELCLLRFLMILGIFI